MSRIAAKCWDWRKTWPNLQQKYYNGVPGNYLCLCLYCDNQFFGCKRDCVCPSCVDEAAAAKVETFQGEGI